jgi:FkbM family methyltransferase
MPLPFGRTTLAERAAVFLGHRFDTRMSASLAFRVHARVMHRPQPYRQATLRNGGRMAITLREHLYRDTYFRGVYEPLATQMISEHLPHGGVFVDVGANAGYFSAVATACVGAAGQVHAIEPAPAPLELLRTTATLNACPICVHPVAVGAVEGEATLHLSAEPTNSGMSSLIPREGTAGGLAVTVPMRSLDGLLAEAGISRVDALKIDVEGYEPEVLAGAKSLLSHAPPSLLVVEVARSADTPPPEDVFESLVQYGYELAILDERRGKVVGADPGFIADREFVNVAARRA